MHNKFRAWKIPGRYEDGAPSGGRTAKDAIDLIRARRSPHALRNPDFARYLERLPREGSLSSVLEAIVRPQ